MECLLGRHGPGGGNQTPSFFLGAAASALLQQSGQATPAAASLLSRAMRRLGDTNAGWAVALGLNTAVVGILGWQLAKQAHGAWLSWRNAGAAVDRLFQLATQGSDAAGDLPAALGQPDEHGVFTYAGSNGALYLRQDCHTWPLSKRGWEWSSDGQHWLPTCHAAALFFSAESHPSAADRLLLQQLQVESSLLSREAPRCSSASAGGACHSRPSCACAASAAAALPPLELPQSLLAALAADDVTCVIASAGKARSLRASLDDGGGDDDANNAAWECGGGTDDYNTNSAKGAKASLLVAPRVPDAFVCPLSFVVMTQPVVAPSGVSYERSAIIASIWDVPVEPLTGAPLRADQLVPNLVLRDLIHAWAWAAADALP